MSRELYLVSLDTLKAICDVTPNKIIVENEDVDHTLALSSTGRAITNVSPNLLAGLTPQMCRGLFTTKELIKLNC